MSVFIAHDQMMRMRLKTQARWTFELFSSLTVLSAKGLNVLQCSSIEPLKSAVARIRDNQFFVLRVVDDEVREIKLTRRVAFDSVAQERIPI